MSRRTAALVGGIAVLAALSVVAFFQRRRPASGPTVSRQLTFTGRANDPVLSPDGKTVAYVSSNQSLAVQRLDGSDPITLVPPSRWLFSPRWTDDGKAILFCMMTDSSRLAATWMIPSVGGTPHEVIQDIDAFDAGPDSSIALLSQRESHQLQVLKLGTHDVVRTIPVPDTLGEISELDWSPNQRWIALEAHGIWVMSILGGTPRQLAKSGSRPRWSPSGDAVYFLDGPRGATDLKMVRVDRTNGQPQSRVIRVVSLPTADRFSVGPAVLIHTQVTLSSQAVAIRYGLTMPHRVEATRFLTEGTGWVNTLSISEDGERIALSLGQGEETSMVIAPFGAGPAQDFAVSPSQETGPSWSPDGKKLVFIRSDSTGRRLMIADYPRGQAQRVGSAEPITNWIGVSAFWSGDGNWLSYRPADFRRIGLIDLRHQNESFLRIPDSLGYGYTGGALLSPDARQVVVSTIHRWNDWGELWLLSSAGQVLRRVPEPFGES